LERGDIRALAALSIRPQPILPSVKTDEGFAYSPKSEINSERVWENGLCAGGSSAARVGRWIGGRAEKRGIDAIQGLEMAGWMPAVGRSGWSEEWDEEALWL